MLITSCDKCGVVLDKNKLIFPDIDNDDGSINTDLAEYNGEDFVPAVPCPVCGEKILERE